MDIRELRRLKFVRELLRFGQQAVKITLQIQGLQLQEYHLARQHAQLFSAASLLLRRRSLPLCQRNIGKFIAHLGIVWILTGSIFQLYTGRLKFTRRHIVLSLGNMLLWRQVFGAGSHQNEGANRQTL